MPLIGAPGTKLMLGIPTLGRPVTLSWATAFKGLNPPMNFNSVIAQVYGQHVADARNEIVKAAINADAKYLFFLGDDVIVPPHTLRQLIFRMEHDPKLGVVGGVYCSKSEPPYPLVFTEHGSGSYWDWKIGDYFPVIGLGMDCTLIRVELLKDLVRNSLDVGELTDITELIKEQYKIYKWFETIDDDKFLDGINSAEQWTEDLRFLKKVTETYWSIYCDSMVMCDHVDVISGQIYNLPRNSYPLKSTITSKIPKEDEKLILDLGCGEYTPTTLYDEGKVLRVDGRKEVNPDHCCDLRQLPFDSGIADIVYSSHVLEHFIRNECEPLLVEWLRVLKPGGELRIVVPNIRWAIQEIGKDTGWYDDTKMSTNILNVLYGAQSNPLDRHFNGFTPGRLGSILENLDLENVKIDTDDYYNIFASATKSQSTKSKILSTNTVIEIDRTDSSEEELKEDEDPVEDNTLELVRNE